MSIPGSGRGSLPVPCRERSGCDRKPDKKRGEIVCAYVVAKEGQKLNKKDLIVFLKANLASYKLPRDIIEMESLTKNATGKILKELREF